MQLVLDDEGRVIDAVPEDQSFTHTLIEMFMVEATKRCIAGWHHRRFCGACIRGLR